MMPATAARDPTSRLRRCERHRLADRVCKLGVARKALSPQLRHVVERRLALRLVLSHGFLAFPRLLLFFERGFSAGLIRTQFHCVSPRSNPATPGRRALWLFAKKLRDCALWGFTNYQ